MYLKTSKCYLHLVISDILRDGFSTIEYWIRLFFLYFFQTSFYFPLIMVGIIIFIWPDKASEITI